MGASGQTSLEMPSLLDHRGLGWHYSTFLQEQASNSPSMADCFVTKVHLQIKIPGSALKLLLRHPFSAWLGCKESPFHFKPPWSTGERTQSCFNGRGDDSHTDMVGAVNTMAWDIFCALREDSSFLCGLEKHAVINSTIPFTRDITQLLACGYFPPAVSISGLEMDTWR